MLSELTEADVDDVLALNDRHVVSTAPLDADRLWLLAERGDVEVLRVDGRFAGFVITFGADSGHDSSNFAWYAQRYDDFCYLDRIVVHEDFLRRGLASAAYDEIEARTPAPLLALEVNSDPPNVASLAFHRSRGYEQVGEREFDGHLVAMLVKRLR